jgi:hypothetical protein
VEKRSTLEWSSLPFLDLCFDDHGSLVIFRSASVRPNHLSDQEFDHDYYFQLPFQGTGCPVHRSKPISASSRPNQRESPVASMPTRTQIPRFFMSR